MTAPSPFRGSLRRPVAVTTFVALVALAAGSCSVLPGGGGGSTRVTAYFSQTVSLFEGSQVRILGLPAGEVTEVAVEGTQVRVELAVDDDVPVPADARATIIPFSLIGERFVQLFPAYTGGPRLPDGAVIPLERTSVPVEPDEALVALRDLLDDLNPEGTRRLTENLADGLEGRGRDVNAALRELSDLTREFGARSDTIGRIIDHFDGFTATLVEREGRIGQVLDDFATVTEVLAQERDHLEQIIENLRRFATDAKDLVEEHGDRLTTDLEVLEHVAQSLEANLDAVGDLLDAVPITGTGLRAAYDPEDRVVNLRNDANLGDATSAGDDGGGVPLEDGGEAATAPETTTTTVPPPPPPQTPFAPVDRLIERLLDGGGAGGLELAARDHGGGSRGGADRFAHGVLDAFGALGGFARTVVGIG